MPWAILEFSECIGCKANLPGRAVWAVELINNIGKIKAGYRIFGR